MVRFRVQRGGLAVDQHDALLDDVVAITQAEGVHAALQLLQPHLLLHVAEQIHLQRYGIRHQRAAADAQPAERIEQVVALMEQLHALPDDVRSEVRGGGKHPLAGMPLQPSVRFAVDVGVMGHVAHTDADVPAPEAVLSQAHGHALREDRDDAQRIVPVLDVAGCGGGVADAFDSHRFTHWHHGRDVRALGIALEHLRGLSELVLQACRVKSRQIADGVDVDVRIFLGGLPANVEQLRHR